MIGFVLFGIKEMERQVGAGSFYCPDCRCDNNYTRYAIARYFSIYLIPVIPLGKSGEFVRCNRCSSNYAADIVDLDRREVQDAFATWKCERCGNWNPAEYGNCVSCNGARPVRS